jgi:antitoxin CptB
VTETLLDKSRLRWLCRRGMKELDVLCERYLQQRYDAAPDQERFAFQRLLACEDPDIWNWVLGYAPVPAEFAHVVERLRGNA